MKVKDAILCTGGLSKPSKMPSCAYNLPASSCKTGGKLRKIKGSVCEKCYACKGRYNFDNVKNALQTRLSSIQDPNWVNSMVTLIEKQSNDCFRWHDSGDLQDLEHLLKIIEVVTLTPNTKHWLPTKEYGVIREYLKKGNIPENLNIRFSSPMVDKILHKGKEFKDCTLSIVTTTPNQFPETYSCPGVIDGTCGACRACWDKNVKIVEYPKH